ncbi:hypothetical protein M501DRAFT_1015422 [Patellaria atrata CBS 101060]|uniref:Uncharacterized protein n=1 Tax=Patellaria atrata CBS 101060 TaxID=1346257 RepID=A0A9P4SCV1_9PEZI|nr:hypothetical protein M501DRAFT_1015422 [Patellaria atrata CBS 101060]
MSKEAIPDDDDQTAFDNPWSSEPPRSSITTRPSSVPGPSHVSQTHLQRQQSSHSDHESSNPTEEPPAYTGPSVQPEPTLPTPSASSIPGMPNLDFSKYQIPESKLSDDRVTLTTTLSVLSSDPRVLERMIKEQAALPPKPLIRIRGSHTDFGAKQVVDFDLRLNMIRYFIPARENWNYIKLKTQAKTGKSSGEQLADWCKRYCKDNNTIKSFALNREVINWNTDYIEGRIRSLLASVSYRGHVDITFPVTHSQVIVHSAPKMNRLFNSLLSAVVDNKKYEVIRAYWPYATLAPDAAGSTQSNAPRKCAVQSEETWWRDWQGAIRYAVLLKRRGWVTLEDQMEFAMGPQPVLNEKIRDWGLEGHP